MELKQAFWILRHGSGEGLREYLKAIKTIEDNCAPVVRCKGCRYWQDNNGGYPNEECRWRENETPDADDFCSYGKRKDGDSNDS